MIPVIQKEVVDTKKWISKEEFLDAIAVTNSLPGPLATNAATYVGYKLAGPLGSFAAVFATALPSFLIILIIVMFFSTIKDSMIVQNIFNGIRPAVSALIFFAVINLTKFLGFNKTNILIALGSFIAITILNVHPFIAILVSGTIGFFFLRKGRIK